MHYALLIMHWTVSVPERLSNIKLKAPCQSYHWRSVLIPKYQYIIKYIGTRFLYYFCLCKSFKELFNAFRPWLPSRLGNPNELVFLSLLWKFLVPPARFWAKAGAKVLLFSEPPKLFGKNFRFSGRKISSLDRNQVQKHPIPYYI